MDDLMGGFDDIDAVVDTVPVDPTRADTSPAEPGMWEVGGMLSASASYNIQDHRSTTGTDYGGLSKLQLRGLLTIDGRLGADWRSHVDISAWQDLAYAYREADYTQDVIDAYEKELEILDGWVGGPVSASTDVKIGRQVAVWGFADNLRVLDILNPLDNLEPGLADIEDLRRPVGMLRVDQYAGPWRLSAYATPEHRFSRNPPFGSDFYSLVDSEGNAARFRNVRPDNFEDIDLAASAIGRFSGWDLSLHAARFWVDEPYLDASAFDRSDTGATEEDFQQAAVLRHSRSNLFGFGVQLTQGGWLLKQEAAVIDDLQLTRTTPLEQPLPLLNALPIVGALIPDTDGQALPEDARPVRRYDALLGVEYFGLADTTFSLELAARHIDDFGPDLARSGYLEWASESAARVTREFMNQRLRLNLIGVVFNADGQFWRRSGGGIYRLDATYELARGVQVAGGVLLYDGGRQQPFNVAEDNDRLFGEVRWQF
ncbi:DUF1302 family protein [Algiphilus sp.]|uniref:DUF1302 family protein n=1 Tax=Algiphilus sp. TaxID=1872431 RepID=UPI003B52FBCB